MSRTANWTIRGSGIPSFVQVVEALLRHNWLWSSVCDNKCDWLVSTDDDTPLDELLAVLRAEQIDCDVVEYGELTTCLEEVPEFCEVVEMDPFAVVEFL